MADVSAHYRFVVRGRLPEPFTTWFPNLQLTTTVDGVTVLEGPVADPAQLAGIVSALCHRNIGVLAVERTEARAEARH